MIRLLAMLLLSLLVGGVMAGILFFFLRRLRRIEEDYWGPRK